MVFSFTSRQTEEKLKRTDKGKLKQSKRKAKGKLKESSGAKFPTDISEEQFGREIPKRHFGREIRKRSSEDKFPRAIRKRN